MIRLNIVDLKPGMVLAQSVRNHQDVLLLDTGAKIIKKNIRIFKSWGVSEVFVEGELDKSKTAAETPMAGIKDILEMELEAKFANVLDDPVMVEIFNAASRLLMKNLQKIENGKKNSRP